MALRVPDNQIALDLLKALGEPILSCSLMLPDNEHMTYSDPEEIHECLERQVGFNYSWWLFRSRANNGGRFNGRIASNFT